MSSDGQNITYDAIGNPLSYRNGMTFTWFGRQMQTAKANGKTMSYVYDADGLRTKKTVDGVLHEYEYSGGRLYYEKYGDYQYFFRYNALGNLATIKRRSISGNTEKSLYVICNSRGDVEELRNTDGTLYARYVYDSWGNTIKILDANGNPITAATNIAVQNPLRYRGYYWDAETGLYYLQSRYYDPVVGRFINADSLALALVSTDSVTDKNLYSYCDNNPVCRADENGGLWYIALAGALTGGAIEFASQLLSNGGDLKKINLASIGVAAVSGGVSASLGLVGGAVVDGITSLAIDIIEGERNVGALIWSFSMSTVSSIAFGSLIGNVTLGVEDDMLSNVSKQNLKQKIRTMYPDVKGTEINKLKDLDILKKECPDVVDSITAPLKIAANTVTQVIGAFVSSLKKRSTSTVKPLKAKGVRGYTI